MKTTQIRLAARPHGEPDDSCFATEVVELPDLEDGQVLLVRHREGVAVGRWSLPFARVDEHEVAEAAATRLLRDVLHLDPGHLEFAHTLTIPAADADVVVNVFDALGWAGEPRYSGRVFDDAGWIDPAGAPDADVVPEVAAWLAGSEAVDDPHDALVRTLLEARAALLDAYAAIPPRARERALDGEWAPVDVLHRVAVAEAYAMDEVVRLIETPGYVWREFNGEQAEVERRLRPRPSDAEVRERVVRAQTETFRMLDALTPEQLGRFGAHPQRGVVAARERIEQIAAHDREHTAQLRAMLDTARREDT